MKKFTTVAAISFALFLSACAPAPADQSQPTQETPSNQNEQESNLPVPTNTENEEQVISEADKAEYEAALNERDTSRCENINNQGLKESCLLDIAGLIEDDMREEANQKREEESEQLGTVVEGGNLAECDTIEDENWRQDCIANITINEVLETRNQSLCSRLESEVHQKNCLDAYNLAVEAEAAS